MITLRPGIEAVTGGWLTLGPQCPTQEIELFLASLAAQLDVEPPGGRDQVVDTLLGEELLLAAGGLRLHDTATGASVTPGCCAGLEDWREWASVLDGGQPWLGHDPGPEVEVCGALIRVWQHGGPRRSGPVVEFAGADLPGLLARVHADLVGFLDRLDAWTRTAGLDARGTALAAAIDRDFQISAPLILPEEGRFLVT
ncbi:hypothetical protein ACIBPB_13180 [Micromonospora sp. NPDC049836]|uniref:hypothetical protein n=1 Tax=Micromonospora sp. NPDC049836 TaxID=3364274 RepID=UPI0037A5286A